MEPPRWGRVGCPANGARIKAADAAAPRANANARNVLGEATRVRELAAPWPSTAAAEPIILRTIIVAVVADVVEWTKEAKGRLATTADLRASIKPPPAAKVRAKREVSCLISRGSHHGLSVAPLSLYKMQRSRMFKS